MSCTDESEEVESEVVDDVKCKAAEELANEIERVRYQNMLMIGRLEQAEEYEIEYEKRIKMLETTLKENEAIAIKQNLDAQNHIKQIQSLNKEIEGFKQELKKSTGDDEMIVTLND